jgi:hypothetical protein
MGEDLGEADWRPLDTAPADENVLIFSARWGALIAEYSSEFGQWFPRMQCPVSLHEEADGLTHWMPLPGAPDPRLRYSRGLNFSTGVGGGFRVSA